MTGNGMKAAALALAAALLLPAAVAAQSDEESVGAAAAARIFGSAPLVDAPETQRYVNLVGSALAAQAGTAYKWRFGVVGSEAVNAFASPGGIVLVTAGLVRTIQNEDELAFVLAHEIAHVVMKHHYSVVLRQRLAEKASADLQASTGGTGNAALSHASAQIYARGLDKSAEYDADRLAAELMTKTGYDPAASMAVLERMQKLAPDDPRAELLFATHPSPAERVDALLGAGLDGLPRPKPDTANRRTARFKQAVGKL
jgi:beta-barrel assembly-enhancing protease